MPKRKRGRKTQQRTKQEHNHVFKKCLGKKYHREIFKLLTVVVFDDQKEYGSSFFLYHLWVLKNTLKSVYITFMT